RQRTAHRPSPPNRTQQATMRLPEKPAAAPHGYKAVFASYRLNPKATEPSLLALWGDFKLPGRGFKGQCRRLAATSRCDKLPRGYPLGSNFARPQLQFPQVASP